MLLESFIPLGGLFTVAMESCGLSCTVLSGGEKVELQQGQTALQALLSP